MAVKVDKKHDFTAKLRQPLVLPRVKDYVKWQKAIRQGIKVETPNLTPISINLDLTTACTYRCPHCIDLDIIQKKSKYNHNALMDSLKNMIECGLRSVIIIGGGEPTLYQKFEEVVRFLKDFGIQVAIVSNGSRNKIIYEAVNCFNGKDWVRLSIDAGTNETFRKMHKPRNPISLEEICSWIPRIRERNPKTPIGFSFIITWEGAENGKGDVITPNIDEIVLAAKLAREYDFNYISYKPFLTRFADGEEVMNPEVISDLNQIISRIRNAINEAKTLESGNFKIIESTNLRVLEEKNWNDFRKQPPICHIQAFRQVLSPIGLFNCPGYRGMEKSLIAPENAYESPKKITGTIKRTATLLTNFDASQECANVTCLFNPVNWWIEKLITGELDIDTVEIAEEHDYFF